MSDDVCKPHITHLAPSIVFVLLTWMCMFAGTLGVIAAIIFGIEWTSPESVMKALSADFSWGYGLFVGGNAVTLTLFIVLCILGKDLRVSQVKPHITRTR